MITFAKFSTPAFRFLAASAIAFGLVPVTAHAQSMMDCGQHQPHYAGAGIPPHFKALNLSQEQQEKLRAIQATHQEVMRKNMEQIHSNKAAERELVEAPSFDEQKAEKLAMQDAKIMGDNNLTTLRFRHEIYQILTPEQRTKFNGMRKQSK